MSPNSRILVSTVHAHERGGATVTVEAFGSLSIDRDAIEVRLDGTLIPLTKTEFLLLDALTRNPRRAMTNQELFRAIWGSEWVDDGALQTQISRLRSKLGESGSSPRMIVTVYGFGYRFEPGLDSLLSPGELSAEAVVGDDDIVAFALISLERKFLWAGGQWERLLGFSPDDLVGTVLYGYIHPEDRRFALAAREELDSGIPAAIRFRMRTAAGAYRTAEAMARPVIGTDGRVEFFLGEYTATSDVEIGNISPPVPVRIGAT